MSAVSGSEEDTHPSAPATAYMPNQYLRPGRSLRQDMLHGRGVHPIRRNNKVGLQDHAIFSRYLAVLCVVFNDLG